MAMVWIVGAVEGGKQGDCLQTCWVRIDRTLGWMIGSGEMEGGGTKAGPWISSCHKWMHGDAITHRGRGCGGEGRLEV